LLSYQHAFHAGNHADVLKHIVLIAMLEKFNRKAKPYFLLDTHAGTGLYDLKNLPKNADATAFDVLLSKVKADDKTAASLAAYLKICAEMQASGVYPGSPYLSACFSREQDTIHMNELSNAMHKQLEQSAKQFQTEGRSVNVHQRDGFELLNALCPPSPKRGMVLIDPPYEQAKEYQDVVEALSKAIKKWPNGSYMIWYPLLSPQRIDRRTGEVVNNPKANKSALMLAALCDLAERSCSGGVLQIEFAVKAPSEKIGMYGSGICIINPPYQIDHELTKILEVLQQNLSNNAKHLCKMHWSVAAK